VYPKRPPAAYKPIAASQGAGPGEPDSALTISSVKEESLQFTLHEVTVSASRTEDEAGSIKEELDN